MLQLVWRLRTGRLKFGSKTELGGVELNLGPRPFFVDGTICSAFGESLDCVRGDRMTTPTSSKILEHLEDRLLLQIVQCYLDRGAALRGLGPYESTEAGFAEQGIAELHAHDWGDVTDTGDRFQRALLGLVERELVTRVVLDGNVAQEGGEIERIGLVKPTRAGLKRADYLEASRSTRMGMWWSERWPQFVIPALVSLVVTLLTLLVMSASFG